MITVHVETLQVTPAHREGEILVGNQETIEITVRGDRRRVACYSRPGSISIFGLAVRFRTGTKVWPGSAVFWRESGNVNNLRPNIDKFNGQWCSLVGYFDDHVNSKHRSQHNAVA